MKFEIKLYSAKCDECEDAKIEYFVALDEYDGVNYYCEKCDGCYDKQMYSLPNSKLLATTTIEVPDEECK